jgi:hypothetical protein
MANLKTVKIFPPIGIARIGNSQEWYIGPELPFPAPPPIPSDGKYKDNQCRVRRQAQRFRLWGYFDDNTDRELTTADGDVQWTVYLANAKPVFRGEPGGLIDPGPRTLKNANDSATFANGTYTYSGKTVEVPLGSAVTDTQGRLIVAGGFGTSDTPVGAATNPISYWLETAGWYDDISDGPVNATIVVGGQTFNAVGAWVICPPPRYAPSTYSIITLYDTMRQVAIDLGLLPQPGQPSFVKDIWPILTRAIGMLRVSALTFGPGDHGSLSTVIPPGAGQDGARSAIFGQLANPNPPPAGGNMPLLNAGGVLPILNEQDVAPTLRKFQYTQMQSWSQGTFTNDWPPVAPTVLTPDGLTQAALENCVGAPFYPGIEATLTVRDGSIKYVEPFRFDQTGMKPGDVTKGMARPWQADFTACTGGNAADSPDWWPAARPDGVYPVAGGGAQDWTRSLVTGGNPQQMVDNWFRLGFVVDQGDGLPVEVERTPICKDCFIITDRNEIGKEEAAALVIANEQIVDAFYVVVEGFAPSDLGITTATPSPMQLQAWAPSVSFSPMPSQMSQQVHDMLLENNGALNQPQRITFGYNISFTGTNDFVLDVNPFQLNATTHGVSSSATIDLTQVDAPYMDHGPISWLSNDTRVFKVQPGGTVVGAPALGSDPIAFIQGVLTHLRTGLTSAAAYAAFEALSADETSPASQLEWEPTLNGQPVFNFALCRIRYRANTTSAVDVRCFFRLFQTAATGTEYNSGTTYRVGGQPGTRIPLLGIQGGELVTIPFFAEARKPANVNLNQQKDDTNKQTIAPAGGGHEAYMYYGCWLDINQNQPSDARFPIQPSPPDGGPFTGTLQSIANLIRGTHQCMVTEINFDLEAITPQGISTASSDMLSQRNLAIDNSDNPGSPDTHRVQHTFAIHPTTANPAPKQGPDEMMIAWGNTPVGTEATIYLPGVRASEILGLAGRNFNLQTLERVDDHTIRCKTAGVTYVPIPAGGSVDLAGLITLDLPANVRKGQNFRVVVRQVMDTPAPKLAPPPTINVAAPHARAKTNQAAVAGRKPSPSRHILGAFQFSVLVKTAKEILPGDERALKALQRVIATVPLENRWYPVLRRYLSQLGGRIKGLGGETGHGAGHGLGHGHEPSDHDHDEHGFGEHERHKEKRISYEGKVSGLIFDRFGDFEGFWLDTEDGKRSFRSREKEIEELVREAWIRRIAILVIVEKEEREEPQSIVLLRPPVDL